MAQLLSAKNTASLPAAGVLHKQCWCPTQAILKIQVGIRSLVKVTTFATYRYPDAYITAKTVSNKCHFGIPLRTSLMTP